MKTSRKVLRERQIGAREVNGTKHPVTDVLYRDERNGKVWWEVALGLCNGVPQTGLRFRTLRDALSRYIDGARR